MSGAEGTQEDDLSRVCPKCGSPFTANASLIRYAKKHNRVVGIFCSQSCSRGSGKGVETDPQILAERKAKTSARQKAWREKNAERLKMRDAEYYLANREAIRARQKAFAQAHPEKNQERRRKKYLENRDEKLSRNKKWSDANKERHNALVREWHHQNPERRAEHRHNRRARKRNAEGSHTAADIQRIGAAQKWKCGWCGVKCADDYHVDHIQPLSCGGSNWPDNLLIACPDCNMSKGAKDPIDFARSIGKLI